MLSLFDVLGNLLYTGKPIGNAAPKRNVMVAMWHPNIKSHKKDHVTQEPYPNTTFITIDVAEALADVMRGEGDVASAECGCRAAELYRHLDTLTRQNRAHRATLPGKGTTKDGKPAVKVGARFLKEGDSITPTPTPKPTQTARKRSRKPRA